MSSFLAAWQFLTVFPVPQLGRKTESPAPLESAVIYFPWVGLLLGILAAALDLAFRAVFPANLAAVCLAISMSSFSGGLHWDGLADTADGFLSSRPRERILENMRDSRSGPMALIAVVSVFALKWAALSELSGTRFWIVLLAPWLGRWNVLLLMNVIPYARSEGGLASVFTKRDSKPFLAISGIVILAVAVAMLGITGLAIVGASLIFAGIFSRYCVKKIGGYTGDTLGAICEITEAVVMLAAVASQGARL